MIYGKEANLNLLAKIFSEFSSTPSLRLWPFLHLQTMLGESPLRLFKIFHDGVPGKHNQCLWVLEAQWFTAFCIRDYGHNWQPSYYKLFKVSYGGHLSCQLNYCFCSQRFQEDTGFFMARLQWRLSVGMGFVYLLSHPRWWDFLQSCLTWEGDWNYSDTRLLEHRLQKGLLNPEVLAVL